MKITYFHRNPSSGYSIGKVSRTYISEIEKTEEVENVYMPCAKADPLSVIRNMWYAFKHRNKSGINHITGQLMYLALILPCKRTVATVHDIGWDYVYKTMNPFRVLWIKCLSLYPLYFCSRVVCISEYTKNELLKIMPSIKHKTTIIPNAVGQEFKYTPHAFNQDKPVVLHIGGAATADRKNLFRTIEALHGLNIQLRIIGHLNDTVLSYFKKYDIEYSNAYDLSDEDLVKEYQNCDIVNFPSLFEGFGMPIIEAQASGCIVVTSNISPMKDVAGDYPAKVNPYDVFAIRNCYKKIISDSVYRQKLLKRGIDNCLIYKATNVAELYVQLYSTINVSNKI